jgi:hypothetical protein
MRSARSTIGIGLAALLGPALFFTVPGRLLPMLSRMHGGTGVYLDLLVTWALVVSAVSLLGLMYRNRVSMRWGPEALVMTNVLASQRTTRLEDVASALVAPVRYRWWPFEFDFRYVLLMGRTQRCLQVLDTSEWPESVVTQTMSRLRASGVPVGQWELGPIGLFGGNGLGTRYPGSTHLRFAPYSLLALSAALLIFSAGILAAVPLSLVPTPHTP